LGAESSAAGRAMRIAAVIMMQILPFADDRALAAYRQFERGVYHAFKQA